MHPVNAKLFDLWQKAPKQQLDQTHLKLLGGAAGPELHCPLVSPFCPCVSSDHTQR